MSNLSLKIIAIITMTIDHIGIIFFPENDIFTAIGRLSFMIITFLLIEGYFHTSNLKKYIGRLIIFGIIIDLIMLTLGLFEVSNVFLSLGFGLLFVTVIDYHHSRNIFIIIILLLISQSLMYGVYGMLLIFLFYVFKKKDIKKMHQLIILVAFTIISIKFLGVSSMQYYSLLALPVIFTYNGKIGYKSILTKYAFYIYYPLHLTLLQLLYICIT